MRLDGLDGGEELRGDFAVRASRGDERGDALLRRGQVAVASRSRVGAPKLIVGAFLPGRRAELAEDSVGFAERLRGAAALAGPGVSSAERSLGVARARTVRRSP